MDICEIADEFAAIAKRSDLVADHTFDSGQDDGKYYNYRFSALKPLALWREVQSKLYSDNEIGSHMRVASMAMCSEEDGWDDYLQLYHFDPTVELDSIAELSE